MRHTFRIGKGSDIPYFLDVLKKRLRATVGKGKDLKITVEEWQSKRSLEQNAYYWVLLTDIAREAPSHMDGQYYAPDVWHEHFRRMFLPMIPGPGGEGVPTSTTALTVSEMSDYITQIQVWMAENLE